MSIQNSEREKIKPIVFTLAQPQDFDQRFRETIATTVNEFAPQGKGYYPGGDAGRLQCLLTQFLESNCNYEGPLVLMLNAHGADTGHYLDGTVTVTPADLWNGYGNFSGLKNFLSPTNGVWKRTCYIVCAQCHGAHFADELEILVGSNPQVQVVGLSYDSTYSAIKDTQYVSESNEHIDFQKWMSYKFSGASDATTPAQSGAGMGAMFQLTTSSSF